MVCDPFTDPQSFKDSPHFNPFHLRMSSQPILNGELGAINYLYSPKFHENITTIHFFVIT